MSIRKGIHFDPIMVMIDPREQCLRRGDFPGAVLCIEVTKFHESRCADNLLLIEDDLRLAQLTSEYLERNGIVVALETDGEQGLQQALRHRFDAVLLDLMLPGRDGISICQRIREHSDVPILIVTARGEEADRVLGLELGADDYLPKPFSPRELLARIRAAVRRNRGQLGPRAPWSAWAIYSSTPAL